MPDRRWTAVDHSGSWSPGGMYRLLGWGVILALTVRLYLLWQYYCISSDGVRYIEAARSFFDGRIAGGLSYYPPAYPLLIASIYPLVGDWELSGQIWSLLSGVLLLIPLYGLFRMIYGEKVALIACFLAAITPYMARYSVHVRTETPFLLLSTIALLLFYQGIERSLLSRFFYGGLVAGLAYLVRPEAIGFLVVVPVTLGIRSWVQKDRGSLWCSKASFLLLLGFSLFAFPYIFYLSRETGQWVISQQLGPTLKVGLRESGLLESEELKNISKRQALNLIQFAIHYPFLYTKKVLLDLIPSVGVYLEAIHYSYVPFFLLGLFHFFRDRFWGRKDFILFNFFIFYLVGFALIYVNRRYAVQLVPVSLGWAAEGVLWCWIYSRRLASPRAFRAAVTVLTVVFLAGTLPKTLKPISRDKAHLREAGRYLKDLRVSGELNLLVSDGRIAFYAGARRISLSDLGERDLLRYLRSGKADYLVTGARLWEERYPSIAKNPELHGLILEREFRSTGKSRLIVFKVKQRKVNGRAG